MGLYLDDMNTITIHRCGKANTKGLYIRCRSGKHYLDGQIDNGHYIGFEIVKVVKRP